MLIVVIVALAVAALGLGVANVRVRHRLDEYVALEAERSRELAAARDDHAAAVAASDDATRTRDEALERVQRSRRDAAEVANRLSEATSRVELLDADIRDLTATNRDLTQRVVDLEAEVEVARRAAETVSTVTEDPVGGPADVSADGIDAEVLWALTLARIDRRWRISVAAGTDDHSPLMTSTSLLADAIGIEVDAAREESGTLIEFLYDGDHEVDASVAATTVTLVEELVAGVTRLADDADLTVTVTGDAAVVSLDARRDGAPVRIPGPDGLVDDEGRYRIGRDRAADVRG